MKDFDDVADFMIVYMEEAHPIEGWRIRVRSFDSLSLYRNGLNTKGLFKVSARLFLLLCGNLPALNLSLVKVVQIPPGTGGLPYKSDRDACRIA